MMTNFEVMNVLKSIDRTLSKATSITTNNYLSDPPNGGSHLAGAEREMVFAYLDSISHEADALHMELRVEDHPELMETDCGHLEDEDCPF